jgi:Zn-dependent peptidase ImmA (M78 family)
MSNSLISDKENFIKLILSNIEHNSSTPERAREYLASEGLDVDEILTSGMAQINALRNKIAYLKAPIKTSETISQTYRTWNHVSVQQLIIESGNPDPMEEIKIRARDLVLSAFEKGWSGPPYSPIELAKILNFDIIPNDEVRDACIVPKGGKFQIQYNPFQMPTRINFSVAHEIAHTLFSDCAQAIRNREERPAENRQLEQLCNAAAAEIQLPYAIFSNDANSVVPSMEGLTELAKKYKASLESVFMRYTEVIDKPCAILIGIFQSDDKITIDYYKASRTFAFDLPKQIDIPKSSNAYECTSPGWTATDKNVHWDFLDDQNYNVYSIGISPYRRDNKPRVGILILPVSEVKEAPNSGKIVLEYGDATKPRGKGRKIIAQVVNTSAALGFGFGKSLAKNYPAVKKSLEEWKGDKHNFKLGKSNLIKVSAELYVFQMLAQKGIFAKDGEIPLRYNELRKCLIELRETALELDASVHMPAIGAGQAKGDWDIIIGMIHDELVNYKLKVNIYLFPDKPLSQSKSGNLTSFNLDSTWENGKLF